MVICAATGNAAKLREIRRILEPRGYQVKSQKELGIQLEPEETGTTFAQNALIKAEAICLASGLPTLADDSGLAVDALGGAPGVYSARYAGGHGDDEANNALLLKNLKEIPEEERTAKFVCAICFYMPGGAHLIVEGECPGHIIDDARGDNGFGYDPLFVADRIGRKGGGDAANTEGLTTSEMEDWQKDAISHRGKALAKLDAALPAFLEEHIPHTKSVPVTGVEKSLAFERNEKNDGDKMTRSLR